MSRPWRLPPVGEFAARSVAWTVERRTRHVGASSLPMESDNRTNFSASYFHGTSRNPTRTRTITRDRQGRHQRRRWGAALDARGLYLHAPETATLATAAARWAFRDLGLGWWQRDDGIWELDGVDDHWPSEFVAALEPARSRRTVGPPERATGHTSHCRSRGPVTSAQSPGSASTRRSEGEHTP